VSILLIQASKMICCLRSVSHITFIEIILIAVSCTNDNRYNVMIRPKSYFASCFRSSLIKTADLKLLLNIYFILVLNDGNRMKIGREMAEI
jgi:hypothetical protein